jgi:hypothetical protein
MNYKLILALLGANSLAVRLNMMQSSVGLTEADASAEADALEGVTTTTTTTTTETQPIAVPISLDLLEADIVGGPITITCDDGSTVMCSEGTQNCFDGSDFYCGTPDLVLPEPEIILGAPTTITCDDGSIAMCSAGTQFCFDGSELYCGVAAVTETTTSMTSSIEGVIETEDPNVTTTYVKDTEISGDVMFVSTMKTTTTVNSDGTETVVVTEALEVFRNGELTQSLESVVSEETRPTTTEFILVEAQPISVGLTEEQARAEADAAEGTTVTEMTTTVTETTGDDEPTVVGLTEEQAQAEADAAEGTTVTEMTTTTTTTTEGEGQPESVGLTEE